MNYSLTLVPFAGLCNRINAMLNAIAIAKSKSVGQSLSLQIYWQKTNDCAAYFDELFQPIPEIDVQRLSKLSLKPANKKNLYIPSMLRKLGGYSLILENSMLLNNLTYEDAMNVYDLSNVYVTSCNRFCKYDEDFWNTQMSKYFVPVRTIQNMISKVTQKFSAHTVGVHVRRTDNAEAIKNNPLDKYFNLMDEEIKTNPETTFYIASDDAEVKNDMLKKYGDRIIIEEWDLSRNTLRGMQHAVADLWCLASTCKIFGSTNSTYSSKASHIYGAEIVR